MSNTEDLARFSVSMEAELLARFDDLLARRGAPSRSEAIRDLVREALVAAAWADPEAEVVGTVTLVYDHHQHELAHQLTDLQHQHGDLVTCATHVHMEHNLCLEAIILRGRAAAVRTLAETLIATRGVKHGQLSCTATGEALP
jgi:CopG family transcriptional regulator, nickel-responsive regulator